MIWINGILQEGSLSSYPASVEKGWIYEVLRVIDGAPVFLPEHLERFWNAAKATATSLPFSKSEILKVFFDLIEANAIENGNIRMQAGIKDGKVVIGFIPHHYPDPSDYEKGVTAVLVEMQRVNPTIKTWNKEIRRTADKIIEEKKVHEVILTTPEGFLTEGSRSNIFGLKKGVLITPPQEYVLPGITRNIVIQLAQKNDIKLEEIPIHKNEIFDFQSFFITGTSPGILPLRKIDSFHFNCKSMPCHLLAKSFEQRKKQSIMDVKKLK